MRRFPAAMVALVLVASLWVFGSSACWLLADSARADDPPYGPPTAFAEPDPESKPCPSAPEPLAEPPPPGEGEEPEPDPDPLRRELRLQRIEAVEVCEVEQASARELQRRLWWAVAEVRPNSGLIEITNERLVQLLDASCGNPCATFAEGGEVKVAGLEGGGALTESQVLELVASIDASGESSSAALYLLAGLVVSCFVGYCLWRTVQNAT